MSYIYDLADTWNNVSTTFTAIKMNVTDIASNAASLLMDLQVGGSSKLKVNKSGDLILNSDFILLRDAANVGAIRNGTNSQTMRVYGTYTSASIYERGSIYADSNGLNISHEQLGATKRPVRILGHSLASSETVSALELLQTWNTSGTPTALKLNITDTASNATSLLMDLQVGGNSKFNVTKSGNLTTASNSTVSGPIDYINGTSGIRVQSSYINFKIGGGSTVDLNSGYADAGALSIFNTYCIGWGANNGFQPDLRLFRDAANTLAQRNGTTAQVFRLYNTYTDSNNYERCEMRWEANTLKFGTFKGGTGVTRIFEIYVGNIKQLSSDGSFVQCDTDMYLLQNLICAGKYQQWSEMTAPAAPAANQVRIYAQDNGSGKTQLMALFNTGAAQQIAIEP